MKNKNIYIIRHGQTDYNLQNIVQGRGVDSDLNKTGQQQAEAFFNSYSEVPFDKIYTSMLRRTQQSVQGFISKGIPTEALEGLDEISWGDHEGLPYDEIRHKAYEDIVLKWKSGCVDIGLANGESPRQVMERQKVAMNHILGQHDETNILIATHGRAMRIMICWMLGRPLNEAEDFEHHNLCLYQLHFDNNQFSIVKNADIDHLNL